MPSQRDALRAHFGLNALSAPPVLFTATPQGKVWGLNGLGNKPQAVADPTAAKVEFLEWLGRAYPEALAVMANALEQAETIHGRGTINGLGETDQKTLVERLVGMAESVLPAYLQYQQQSDILDVQLDRARQGLPPLNTGEYAASMQIGLDRETVARIADEAAARARNVVASPLPWIVGGVGALALVFMMIRKKRRR